MTRAEFEKANVDIRFKERGYQMQVGVSTPSMRKAAIVKIKAAYLPTVAELRNTLDWLEVGCIDKVVI